MVKRTKIALLMVAVVAAVAGASLSQAAPADCRPGGSPTNFAGSCETSTGDLKCGDGEPTPAGPEVTAGDTGVEVCNEDGGAIPVEGRVGADADCQCIYLDGGDSNPAPADGWARIDLDGVHCRPANGGPSYNSGGGTPEDCG